ncbi:MAG TPA: lipoyl(octanoyl) transferase LipB [Burkholderiaceae bacterium]|nr:lipoyl(octanoyl) transferase LipB [Burkholderiaceae bacterium]
MPPMTVRPLGLQDYQSCFDAMRAFTASRTAETADTLWLVEHPPVYTLGQAGDPSHLLDPDPAIPLVRIDRGGQITYHGPGQIVVYLLLDLKRRRLMVRELVNAIEAAVIRTLARYNLASERKAGAPGIYLSDGPHRGAKIAALGLKIRNGCSYHGVSLNVDMDLAPFLRINPCGYAGLETIDMARAGAVLPGGEAVRRNHQPQIAQQFAADLAEELELRRLAAESSGERTPAAASA